MSDAWQVTNPWSDNPNAPKIPLYLYTQEKSYFAGMLIASILYGMYHALLPEVRRPALIPYDLL